jgi:hypothetical protein
MIVRNVFACSLLACATACATGAAFEPEMLFWPATGALVTFDFTGESGNQTSTAPKSTVLGISAGSISRSGSLAAVAGTSSINASNWAASSTVDPTHYFTLTITPDPKCTLDVTSVSADTKVSSTGPSNASVATSHVNFAARSPLSVGAPSTAALSVSGAMGAVEFRVYGYGAGSTSGTMRMQSTVSVSGTLR